MKQGILPGCWLDVFELSHFRGRRRRLLGPNQFNSIRSRSATWGISIDSMLVGPNAYIRMFSAADVDSTLLWLFPRQLIEDVINLRVDDSADSVQILAVPPVQGERGYEAYIRSFNQLPNA